MDNLSQLTTIYDNLITAGIIRTQKDFAKFLKASESTVSKAMKGDSKALNPKFMKRVELAARAALNAEPKQDAPSEPAPQPSSAQHAPDLVPTIPFKVYNETGVNLQEYVQNNPVPKGPAIAQFAATDLHMFVSNDEMKPHLRSGDVLSLKRVPQEAPIINGEIYVINSHYLGLTVRFLFDRGTHYELKSSNEWFEPFNLPKEQVFGIYRILGLVRTNL